MFDFRIFIALLCALATPTTSTVVDVSRLDHVSNDFANCSLRVDSGAVLCKSSIGWKTLQLNSVRQLTMCPKHYCATYDSDKTLVTCTGYILQSAGRWPWSANQFWNPLTPQSDRVEFHGDKSEVIQISKWLGSDGLVLYSFEVNVVTRFDTAVSNVTCADPFSTCIELSSGDRVCFGLVESDLWLMPLAKRIFVIFAIYSTCFYTGLPFVYVHTSYELLNCFVTIAACVFIVVAPIIIGCVLYLNNTYLIDVGFASLAFNLSLVMICSMCFVQKRSAETDLVSARIRPQESSVQNTGSE